MVTEMMKAANAMGGKTARACDGCLRKRARWYCVADDAFLCQGCDSSVHSANQLASRHERVRLETRTLSSSSNKAMHGALTDVKDGVAVPLWHQGFTRKARTPRPNKAMLVKQAAKAHEDKVVSISNDEPLVPELGSEEGSLDDDDANADREQLLCQVPVFDPFEAEINCDIIASENGMVNKDENMFGYGEERTCNELDDLHGFLPSDMDLAEFAADVESLLGVKVKDEEADHQEGIIDWNFDFDSPVIGQDEEDDKVLVPLVDTAMANSTHECNNKVERNISLRLDYEAVIDAWASQGCPWTTGSRPEFNHDDCWLDCTGACPKHVHHPYGGVGFHVGGRDGGREARVSRYKEKRRTRLFSKKIRYEVRKLNAEKRPRMKGRFVKRTSFMGNAAFPYLNQ
ncbi:hypothetical protein LWI29_009536 [Acer saccharum]|uniref:Zinc finger protein CONSTANS-LIKE 16 n=1 Tax=Acer saccharum TaxID=4024 RepID=A0AA39S982_ACESA|nr:hypothetical protein LWI29_009536 [Acer saccharum]